MPAPQKITILGTTYRSLRQAAAAFDFPESTLRYRIQNHIESPIALMVVDNSLQLLYVGADCKGYYRIGEDEHIYTAREIIELYRPDLLLAYDKCCPNGKYNEGII